MATVHIPVMLKEVIEYLKPQPGQTIFDGTLGGGGYAAKISELIGKDGTLIGTDKDAEALRRVEQKTFVSNTRFFEKGFGEVASALAEASIQTIDGAVLDLGLSSDQLDMSARGFSFKNREEPLTMSFISRDSEERLTAQEILETWDEENIADILYGFGGEQHSRRIAKQVVAVRAHKSIATVGDLLDIIDASVPAGYKHRKTHPATKTFQALRIATNQEWKELQDFLDAILPLLAPGGRVVIVSFHSGEDRVVKHTFKQWQVDGKGEILTKKPVGPTDEEAKQNPRSRSALLRAFQNQ